MDPNTSIGRLCLGENNQGLVAEGIENKEQWEGPEFQDTTSSGQDKEAKVFTFYRMEEKGERYFTPCYMGGLHAYDGEINLKYEKNLISNESTVKLCLEYEEKNREKLVKKELSFIVNSPKELLNFGNGGYYNHPERSDFGINSKETEKFEDDRNRQSWISVHKVGKRYPLSLANISHPSIIPIVEDAPILVVETFRAAKTGLNTKESDCDVEEEYGI
ncbi:hypothetical protein Tco_0927862 [Tanacetum coccineum]